MAVVDKNKATLDFLLTCDAIRNNPLYFNFINAKDNNKQFLTSSNDINVNQRFIDGTVMRRYTFTIIDFKSVALNAVVTEDGYPDENVTEMAQTQAILDWVNQQADERNFPNFGEDCIIEEMVAVSDSPNLSGIDTRSTPTLAQYRFTIRITYLDTSKAIWK